MVDADSKLMASMKTAPLFSEWVGSMLYLKTISTWKALRDTAEKTAAEGRSIKWLEHSSFPFSKENIKMIIFKKAVLVTATIKYKYKNILVLCFLVSKATGLRDWIYPLRVFSI